MYFGMNLKDHLDLENLKRKSPYVVFVCILVPINVIGADNFIDGLDETAMMRDWTAQFNE